MPRHGHRDSATIVQQAPATVAGASTQTAEPIVSTVSTVSTVPSVTERPPAPSTASQRRRRGIETPVRRAIRLREEAKTVSLPTAPYGAITPFVTAEGTVDIAKMVTDLGSEKTAAELTAAGYRVTPKVVEVIAAGKDVPGMTTVDRAILASLMGLSGVAAVMYITNGQLSNREAALNDVPADLKEWYSSSLSGVTAASTAAYLWPTATAPTRQGGGPRRAGGTSSGEIIAEAQYLKESGFSSAEVVTFVQGSNTRWSEGELGYVLSSLAGKTAPEGVDGAWYSQQIANMESVLAAAREKAQQKIKDLKASGKDYSGSTIDRIYMNAYPRWSGAYARHAKSLPKALAHEADLAARQAAKAELIPGAEITEIAIGATAEELATAQTAAQAAQAAGKGCPETVNTYKVRLKNGDVILVQALSSGTKETGAAAAIAKAKAANYDTAWATRKMSYEKVYAPSRMPAVDVGYYTVTNAEGEAIKIHVPVGAPDSIALEIADAYGLRGDPSTFQITGRGTAKVTKKQAGQILSNAESASGRLYGLMYMVADSVFNPDSATPPNSIPVRSGDAKTDVVFLEPEVAASFRNTATYKQTRGTDIQRINTAYQEYVNAPRIEMPGGWSMLVKSIKDAFGGILVPGFDSLSPEGQAAIKNEIEQAAGGEEPPTAEDAGVDESEIADDVTDEQKGDDVAPPGGGQPLPDTSPQPVPVVGVTIPITDAELQSIARAEASGQCVGTIRTYYTVKNFKVTLKNGDVIVVESLSETLAKQKAKNANYDVMSVRRMFSWENPADIVPPEPKPEPEKPETEHVPTMAEFEANLATQPKFLSNAYAIGGLSGYNAAVVVYNDTIRRADRIYSVDKSSSMPGVDETQIAINRTTPEGRVVDSPEFQHQYAAVLQPAGMSNTEYAKISPFITPGGIKGEAALQAGIPGSAFNAFTEANVSQETRDGIASGKLTLLPYGAIVPTEDFNKYDDVVQKTLRDGGLPLLAQREAENIAANQAQSWQRNTADAFYLNSIGLLHNLKSAGMVELRNAVKTDWKAGDLNPIYASDVVRGLSPFMWGNTTFSLRFTQAEADATNARAVEIIKSWDDGYDAVQRAQLNWEAEHPLLQPVFPEGPWKAFQNLESAKDIPLIISETIMATAPYTLATLGVSAAGFLVGGPAGVAMTAPFVFAITYGSEGHQIYADALTNGATREQAHNLMQIYGSLSALVETAGDSLMAGAVGSGVKLLYKAVSRRFAADVIAGAAKQIGWAKLTGNTVLQFLNQAGQEGTQQLVANAAIRTFNEERPLFEGVWDAFVGGLIGTAPFILIPAGGQAMRLSKGFSVADVENKLKNASFRPSDQKTIADNVLRSLSQLVGAIGSTPAARKAAALYVKVGQLALHYTANAAELVRVRESLAALKGATQKIDQETVDKLQARAQELSKEMAAESKDLESVTQDLVDLLSSLRGLDESAREAIQSTPREITAYIEELVGQTMRGRKGAQAGGLTGMGRQRAYQVSTFAKTVDDARAAVSTIRGLPKASRLTLQIAVNDMTYALARLGDAIQAAPGMARKAVLDAVTDLELKVKRVYDLLKSLPEASKVKLLQTVNEISNFAASARFAASNAAQIVANDLEYAFTSVEDALKAAPGAVAGAAERAMTDVDIVLKKAADAISELPDEAVRELSKAVASMNLAAKDARTYVNMYGRVAVGELAYGAGLAQEAIQAVPAEVSAAARRAGRAVKRKAGEGVLLTRMAAQVVANDIEYAVQSMIRTIKEAPERAAQAVADALRKIRTSLRSAKLTSVMAVKIAYNDLSYAAQRLVDAIRATPGVISNAVQAAIDGVVGAANKLVGQARYLATLVGDVRALAAGNLAYYTGQLIDHTNQLVEVIRSTPQIARQAVLDALDAIDREVLVLKRRAKELPATVVRYVNSVSALSQAIRAAVKNKVDFSILSMQLTVYGLQEKAGEIRDTIKASPGKAKALVADAILTSRVKLKQIPGNIEYSARNYMADLKRDILRAEENRLNKAYFSVGEGVMKTVKSEFNNVISGRKKLESKEYGSVVGGLADLMTALLRAVQGTEFSDEVEDAVNGVAEAVFSGDTAKTEKAGANLEELLATVPGLSRDKKKVPPKMRTLRQLIADGGSYVRRNADDIVKSVQYKVILEDILATETWGDTKVKLENFRDLLKDEQAPTQEKQQARIQEDQALSDYLSQVNWEMGATKQERKEPPPQLSIREQQLQTLIQGRISKMMQPWGQGANQFRRDMQSSFPSVKEEAMKRFSEWMEGMYGRDWLDEITKEAEGQLMDTGEFAETSEAGEAVQGRWVPEPEKTAGEAPEDMIQLESVGGHKQMIVSGITDLTNLLGKGPGGLTTIDEAIADDIVELNNRGLRTGGSDAGDGGRFFVTGELSDDSMWGKLVGVFKKMGAVPWELDRDLMEGGPDYMVYGPLKKGDTVPGRFVLLDKNGNVVGRVEAESAEYVNKKQDIWGGEHMTDKYYWSVTGNELVLLRQFMDSIKSTFPIVTNKFKVLGPAYVTKRLAETGVSRYWQELEETLDEAERILKENKDRPPDAPPPGSLSGLRPPSSGSAPEGAAKVPFMITRAMEITLQQLGYSQVEINRMTPQEAWNLIEKAKAAREGKEKPPTVPPAPKKAGPRIATMVKEKVEVKPKTEELTAIEKEALEKAKQEQAVKEASEEGKKRLEEAEKRRLAKLAEEAAKKEKEQARRKKPYTRPGPAPGAAAVTRVVGKTLEAPGLGTSEMAEIAPAVMPGIETEVQVAPAIEIEPAIQTGAQIYPAIQTELYPAVHAETQQQPAVRTQTQVQPQVQTETQVQPAVQTQIQAQTQVQTQVQPQTQLQVQVATKIPPWWKLPPAQALAEAYRRGIPILIWKMGKLKAGEVWKAVIDPQKQSGLLTVIGTAKLPVRPAKIASGPGSALKTLQWLGKGPRHKGSADLGIVDVFWGRKGEELKFVGKGLGTDVGMRIPSPTTGISLETDPSAGSTTAKKPSKPPKGRVVAASPAGFVVPNGSLVWASGAIEGEGISRVKRVRWYYLAPPYTGTAVPLSGPPHGVSDPGGFDPVTTLQTVGRSRKAIPNVRVDLGFAVALIANGIIEEVTPKMETIESMATARRPGIPEKVPTESEVAEQVSSVIEAPVAEAGIEGEAMLELPEEPEATPVEAKTRVGLPKKVPRRKKPLTEDEYMTTLKGFSPYTFKGA